MGVDSESLGFSADEDMPVRYIERTHAWYEALGTNNPYRYASFSHVPFTPLRPVRTHAGRAVAHAE